VNFGPAKFALKCISYGRFLEESIMKMSFKEMCFKNFLKDFDKKEDRV